MKLHVEWGKPVQLKDASAENMVYRLDVERVTKGAGVYVFGRGWGQQSAKCIALAERALIRYFLSEGHDLVNKQGTRLRRHELTSSGKHPKRFFPTLMYLERAKGE